MAIDAWDGVVGAALGAVGAFFIQERRHTNEKAMWDRERQVNARENALLVANMVWTAALSVKSSEGGEEAWRAARLKQDEATAVLRLNASEEALDAFNRLSAVSRDMVEIVRKQGGTLADDAPAVETQRQRWRTARDDFVDSSMT
jgi:hypothetical protein